MFVSRNPETGRFFPREFDFVQWLAQLLQASSTYKAITIEPLLVQEGVLRPMVRADIIATRRVDGEDQVLLIECKNTATLYGQLADRVITQLQRYQGYSTGSRLVLAIPGNVPEDVARKINRAGIELWDIDFIQRNFANEIQQISPSLVQTVTAEKKSPEEELIFKLKECEPGRSKWAVYQKLVGRIVEHLFCPPLNQPIPESPDLSGANRRDFILANFAASGLWEHLQRRYQADYIVIDAKNYAGKVKKRDVLQIANYLKPHGAGMFGIIFSRNGGDNSALTTAREQWSHYKKLTIILNDQHTEAMLQAGKAGNATAVLEKEIQDFRLSM